MSLGSTKDGSNGVAWSEARMTSDSCKELRRSDLPNRRCQAEGTTWICGAAPKYTMRKPAATPRRRQRASNWSPIGMFPAAAGLRAPAPGGALAGPRVVATDLQKHLKCRRMTSEGGLDEGGVAIERHGRTGARSPPGRLRRTDARSPPGRGRTNESAVTAQSGEDERKRGQSPSAAEEPRRGNAGTA